MQFSGLVALGSEPRCPERQPKLDIMLCPQAPVVHCSAARWYQGSSTTQDDKAPAHLALAAGCAVMCSGPGSISLASPSQVWPAEACVVSMPDTGFCCMPGHLLCFVRPQGSLHVAIVKVGACKGQ